MGLYGGANLLPLGVEGSVKMPLIPSGVDEIVSTVSGRVTSAKVEIILQWEALTHSLAAEAICLIQTTLDFVGTELSFLGRMRHSRESAGWRAMAVCAFWRALVRTR